MKKTTRLCACGLHWGHTGKHAHNLQCAACKGFGQVIERETRDDLEMVDCKECLGTGVRMPSDADMSGAGDIIGYANDR